MVKQKKITLKELKTFTGFELYTDDEAETVIKDLEALSILLFELNIKQKEILVQTNDTPYYQEPESNLYAFEDPY